jgi:light-regulated signal transduction histidine kinase (bacteriophytochrome)
LFQNIIGNGIKFHGDQPPRIHLSARRQDDRWEFTVRDNGIGIESQYWEQIFVIFQRLHTRKKYSGTGIGLAICKRIVERHGGRIWLDSQPGQGTTFHFTLP